MTIVNAEKRLVDKLIHECTETIEEVKLAKITFAKNENKYSSSTVHIVLMIVIFTIFTLTCYIYIVIYICIYIYIYIYIYYIFITRNKILFFIKVHFLVLLIFYILE